MGQYNWTTCSKVIKAEVNILQPEHAFRDALIKAMQAASSDPLNNPIPFVLNACRASAYLSDGTILSKDAGGVWGLDHIPEQYHPLIHQALALYRGERMERPVGHAALNDFAAYMHETILPY